MPSREAAMGLGAKPLRGEALGAVLAEEPFEQIDVELGRIEIARHRFGIALFPMLDDVVQEVDRPSDAAFEEGEAQIGEAPGDAAEDQRAAEELRTRGEIAQMIVDIVRRRAAIADAA